MEANCFVFPSPSSYNLAPIQVLLPLRQNKIILVPRDSGNNLHQVYSPQSSEDSFHPTDEFADYLAFLDKGEGRVKAAKQGAEVVEGERTMEAVGSSL